MTLLHTRLFWLLILPSLLLAGCKDKKVISVYLVSKPTLEVMTSENKNPAMEGMPSTPLTGTSKEQGALSAQMTGTPPANWEQQPLTMMRQASYVVKGEHGTSADISLVTLTGAAGGVLDNVNRWLSQLGQPAITAEQLKGLAIPIPSPLGAISIVDLAGLPQGSDASKDGRIIAGIVSGDNGTYFFKMRGNADLVKSEKETFIQWIGTVPLPVSLPASMPESTAPTMTLVAPSTEQEKPQIAWDVPSGWKSVSPSPMRYASFTVAGKGGESGDVSISFFPGDGGGDLANVNRWRAQIGLEAINDEGLKSWITPVPCSGSQMLGVDMNGPKARILAGWTRVDGKSWFFKLVGPTKLVEGEKAKFLAFLHTVKFHL